MEKNPKKFEKKIRKKLEKSFNKLFDSFTNFILFIFPFYTIKCGRNNKQWAINVSATKAPKWCVKDKQFGIQKQKGERKIVLKLHLLILASWRSGTDSLIYFASNNWRVAPLEQCLSLRFGWMQPADVDEVAHMCEVVEQKEKPLITEHTRYGYFVRVTVLYYSLKKFCTWFPLQPLGDSMNPRHLQHQFRWKTFSRRRAT